MWGALLRKEAEYIPRWPGVSDLSPVPAPSQGRSKTPNMLTQEPWCGTHPIPPPQAPVPHVLQVPMTPTPTSTSLCTPLHPSGAERPDKDAWGEASRQPPHPLIPPSRHWPWASLQVTDFCSCSEGWKLWSHFTDEETKAQWGAWVASSAFWSLSPLSPKQSASTAQKVWGHEINFSPFFPVWLVGVKLR